ncbi:MAG: hypothetical protein GWO04_32060, partial [Actinobacteria bacterium]|nr:hypothetical protein [Actinomycetota bacterium]
SLIGDNQDLSVLLAIEAVEIEPTPESLEALHRTVGEHRLVATFAATGLSAAWVDERRVAALQADGSVHIVEARTGDQEAALGPVAGSAAALGAITSPELSVSHDGRLLGAALPDGTFDVWSIETSERLWTIRVGELTPSVAWHPAEPLVAVRGLDRRFAEIASPEPFQTGAAEGAILDALSGDVVEELPSCFCPAEVSFDGLGRLWLQADSEGLRPSATLSAFVEVGPGAWGRSGDLRISAPLAEQSAASLNRVVVSAGTTARASTFSGTIVASFSGHGADIRDIAVYDE